ncbi:hypothetical protein C8J57DRAFT_1730492 [Mycena rebaudengoi]|nr:hypothetical protein C8J57DRAFT_1730492 [Mycena rebaudengoi]
MTSVAPWSHPPAIFAHGPKATGWLQWLLRKHANLTKGASSSPTLRIAAPVARDGHSNVTFRSNRPVKADSSTYAGYRPHSQPCVRPLQIPILLPFPPVYLIPVLYCLDRSLRPHPGTGGGVPNSMTVTGLFFGVPAHH